MELTDRLKIVITKSGLKQSEIAEKAETNAQYLNQILSGRNNPSLSLLTKIANVLDVNLHWLITGNGEMTLATTKSNIEQEDLKSEVESLRLELLNLYRFIAERGLKFDQRFQIGQ